MFVQVVFGYGVGGEYPIASASAAERAEAATELQFKRGETVLLVFAMQVSYIEFINTKLVMYAVAVLQLRQGQEAALVMQQRCSSNAAALFEL